MRSWASSASAAFCPSLIFSLHNFQLSSTAKFFVNQKGEGAARLRRLAIFQNHFQEVSHGGPGDRIGQTEAGDGEDIG